MSGRQEIEDTGETETEERLVFLLKKETVTHLLKQLPIIDWVQL